MKILFLEDRPSRQRILLPNKDKDVEVLKKMAGLSMPGSDELKKIISGINNSTYTPDKDVELIIIHGSALNANGLKYLNKICIAKKVKFICFSGGVSQQIFNNDEVEYLNINSLDLYTPQLIPFLENFITNKIVTLLEVANNNWKLTYLFLARQIINSEQEEKNEDRKLNFQDKLSQFKTILNLNNLSAEIIEKEIEKHILHI